MRLVAGSVLVARGIEGLLGNIPFGGPPFFIVRIVLGLLVWAGLWTPVAGAVTATLEVALLLTGVGDLWLHLLLTTLGVCLSLLGPGAWSADARLFGWRRIDIDDRPSRR